MLSETERPQERAQHYRRSFLREVSSFGVTLAGWTGARCNAVQSTFSAETETATDTPQEGLAEDRIADSVFVYDLKAPKTAALGEAITVGARVGNPLSETEVTAMYHFAGEPHSETSLTVGREDSERICFEYAPSDLDPGIHTHGIKVSSENIDYLSEPPKQVSEIHLAAETTDQVPVVWQLSELRGPSAAMGGEEITVETTVTNWADDESASISLVDDVSREQVTVPAGESRQVRFDFPAPHVSAGAAGRYPFTVRTRNAHIVTTFAIGHAPPPTTQSPDTATPDEQTVTTPATPDKQTGTDATTDRDSTLETGIHAPTRTSDPMQTSETGGGFGIVGAIASLCGTGYLIHRRRDETDNS